jgi:hypothetical protein
MAEPEGCGGIYTELTPDEDPALFLTKLPPSLQPIWKASCQLISDNAPHWPRQGPERVSDKVLRATTIVINSPDDWHFHYEGFPATPYNMLKGHVSAQNVTVSLEHH